MQEKEEGKDIDWQQEETIEVDWRYWLQDYKGKQEKLMNFNEVKWKVKKFISIVEEEIKKSTSLKWPLRQLGLAFLAVTYFARPVQVFYMTLKFCAKFILFFSEHLPDTITGGGHIIRTLVFGLIANAFDVGSDLLNAFQYFRYFFALLILIFKLLI